jgi:hypothetical protein
MSEQTSKAPTHTVYTVRDGKNEGDKGFFTRIGAAWPIKDGAGFNIVLDAYPVNGRCIVLPKKSREEDDDAAE